jgi:hypothetical protein
MQAHPVPAQRSPLLHGCLGHAVPRFDQSLSLCPIRGINSMSGAATRRTSHRRPTSMLSPSAASGPLLQPSLFREPIDLLITAPWVVPVEPEGLVLENPCARGARRRDCGAAPAGRGAHPLPRPAGDRSPRPRPAARAGQRPHPRRHEPHARTRRRSATDDVAARAHLARRAGACQCGVRRGRRGGGLCRDDRRRHHDLQRHVLLSRGRGRCRRSGPGCG